jgi:dTMP kinase
MFITFEGIDGCGKTTQLNLFHNFLLKNKKNVLNIREPGGTDLSEKIRKILLSDTNSINPISELLLFEAARANLVENVIIPALQKNITVLSDRFYDSTVAYQGFGREINLEYVHLLNKMAALGIVPDITFYFRVPLNIAIQRRNSEEADRMEKIGDSFFNKVINGFEQLAINEPNRIIIIDGSQSMENTFSQVINFYQKYLLNIDNK